MRWLAGFIFHRTVFGLLSVLMPLYITQTVIGGSLTVWGIIAASATFMAIPFSFLWGYLCDATQRYRFFILLSFAAITILLYLFTLSTNLLLLGMLYTFIVVFRTAHEPSKNVLIAESHSHVEWRHAFALYEVWTKLGWVIGLLLGFILISSGLDIAMVLLASVGLSLFSFLASMAFVTDPPLIFERGLVSIEKSINLVQRGAALLSRETLDPDLLDKFKQENTTALCLGLVFFSLATNMFLIPLPVFFAANLALPTSVIFVLFLLSSISGLVGNFLVKNRADLLGGNTSIQRVALLSCLLVLLFAWVPFAVFPVNVMLSATALIAVGFVFALYSVSIISVSMEVIPHGQAGLFTALVGAGSAVGCLAGPLIAANLGFHGMFIGSSACFVLSLVAFKKFTPII